jgi:hypothetical protein
MLHYPAWQAEDQLARAQFFVFHAICDQLGLCEDDRRVALALDRRAWGAWREFVSDGPLPTEPPLPEMLQRLGMTTYRMSVEAEQHAD